MNVRKVWLYTTLCVVLAWCMGAVAFASSAKPVPLRTAWLAEHETFLVWYAKEKGWDKAEGLDLILLPFDSGKAVIDEMDESKWAVAGVGAMPALTASLSHKLYIIAIGNDESATNALYVRKDSPILQSKGYSLDYPNVYGKPDTVRGKTILCPKGTSAHYMLSRWLHSMGLSDKDVAIRDMKPGEALKAFGAGVGDAVAVWAPQTYEAEKMGLQVAARSNDCNARQPILIVANMDYTNKHPEHIVAFLRVYLRSVDMVKNTPPKQLADAYRQFHKSWTGQDLSQQEAIKDLEEHPVYSLDEQLAMFDPAKGELGAWLHGIVSFHIDAGDVPRRNISRLERLDYVTKLYLKKVKQSQ